MTHKEMFSIHKLFVIYVILFMFSTHSTTNLVKASLSVMEQASSSKYNNDTDGEIAFISVNGNLLPTTAAAVAATTAIESISVSNETRTTISTSTTGSNPSRVLRRGKRYLDLLDTSRMIFRVNIKNNIIPKPTIWAHGYGFRCNYPIDNNKKARPFRRDTYEVLGDLIDNNGFDGQACILKAFCTAHMDEDVEMRKGMLFKLLKYVFTLNDEDKSHFPYLRHENCQQILHSHCPLSFKNLSPYSDQY